MAIRRVTYSYGACPNFDKDQTSVFVEALIDNTKKYKSYLHAFMKENEFLGSSAEEIALYEWFDKQYDQERKKPTVLGEYLHNFLMHENGEKKPTRQEINLHAAVRNLYAYSAEL